MELISHLYSACYFGRSDITRELLNQGANANSENIRGETPLHLVSRGRYDTHSGVDVVRLLLQRGANVNAQEQGRATPLHFACYFGKLEIAQVLLDGGARVDMKNELGQTPLHLVLESNRSSQDGASIIRLLLEHGAEVDIRDTYQESPLHLASSYGKLAIGRVLLDHGANVNAENFRGQTPLHMLSPRPWRFEDVVEFAGILVDGGADVDARDRDQETPLHTAYRKNRLDIARYLLVRGADDGAENYKGETPSQLAPRLMTSERDDCSQNTSIA
jgi:ankyrin repeat protein